MTLLGAEAASLMRPWSGCVVGKMKHSLSEGIVKPTEVKHPLPQANSHVFISQYSEAVKRRSPSKAKVITTGGNLKLSS